MIDMFEENTCEISHCPVRTCKSKEIILKSCGGRTENKEGKETERERGRKGRKRMIIINEEKGTMENPIFRLRVITEWYTMFMQILHFLNHSFNCRLQKTNNQ